jgi:hypothetical protein
MWTCGDRGAVPGILTRVISFTLPPGELCPNIAVEWVGPLLCMPEFFSFDINSEMNRERD